MSRTIVHVAANVPTFFRFLILQAQILNVPLLCSIWTVQLCRTRTWEVVRTSPTWPRYSRILYQFLPKPASNAYGWKVERRKPTNSWLKWMQQIKTQVAESKKLKKRGSQIIDFTKTEKLSGANCWATIPNWRNHVAMIWKGVVE